MEAAEILCAVAFANRSDNYIADGGAILEMAMPNGKKLGECTFEEIGRYGEWLLTVEHHIETLKSSA